MTTTYAVLPQVCPGTNRMPKRYRSENYYTPIPEHPEGLCRSCGQWLPVDWNGADPEKGYRTIVAHEVRRVV